MVIRCSLCNGLMRVDESSLPKDARVKLRCPHCQGIALLSEMVSSEAPFQSETGEPTARSASRSAEPGHGQIDSPSPGKVAQDSSEPNIPHDAFRDFRFPTERQGDKTVNSPRRSHVRTLVFVLASLAVVLLFALLVNLILPGPSGPGYYKGAIPEDATPETSSQAVPPQGR